MRRSAAVLFAVIMGAAACGGSSGTEDSKTAPTDSYGNPLKPGQDWSGVGLQGGENGSARAGSNAAGAGNEPGANAAGVTTTIPYGCEGSQVNEPPPDFATPLAGQAASDFPLKATVVPPRGDAGSEVTIDVTAVGEPKALAVIVASFYDEKDHGMRAAKFTDSTGRARFEGPIPMDAPIGWAAIAVSVTTEDQRSAIDIVNFVVTGEGCR